MSWDEAAYIVNEVKKNQSGTIVVGQGPAFGSDGGSGLPPDDLLNMVATGGYDGQIGITFSPISYVYLDGTRQYYNSSNELINSSTVPAVRLGGVRIIRKQGSAPRNHEDGVVCFDKYWESWETIPSSVKFTDTGLTDNIRYYYAAYPYSDHGVYNYRRKFVVSAMSAPHPVYTAFGFTQNFEQRDPSLQIEYKSGCDNYNFDPAMTNSGNGTPTLGSWGDFLKTVLKNFPCAVDISTGKAIGYLSENNYASVISGTDADLSSTSQGHYAWLNKIYMKEEYNSAGTIREVEFTMDEVDGFYPVGFYNDTTSTITGLWLPMTYQDPDNWQSNLRQDLSWTIKGVKANNVFSGNRYFDKMLDSYDTFRGLYADKRIRLLSGGLLNLIRDLSYMIFKSSDIQKCSGYGYTNDISTKNDLVGRGTYIQLSSAKSSTGGFFGNANPDDVTSSTPEIFLGKLFHSYVLGSYADAIIDGTMTAKSGYGFSVNQYTLAKSFGYADSGNSLATWSTGMTSQYAAIYRLPISLRKVSNEYGSIPFFVDALSESTSYDIGLCDQIENTDFNNPYNSPHVVTRYATRRVSSSGSVKYNGPCALDAYRAVASPVITDGNQTGISFYSTFGSLGRPIPIIIPDPGYTPDFPQLN